MTDVTDSRKRSWPCSIAAAGVVAMCGVAIVWAATASAADWPTHRGNAARTGNVDGQPGPSSPRVLWVAPSTDHYLAPPVATDQAVYVSGLGAFNTATFQALAVAPNKMPRLLWSKAAPSLKLPTVCPPAIAGDLLIFGDGMHQTDGAVLHALRAESGMPVWEYSIPGTLVHLEGGTTVVGSRVYFGAGSAGVLSLDFAKLELDGKELDQAAAQALLKKQWDAMVAKYEQEKKVDPDFAIPPNDEALPKPRPKRAWQQGAGQWHVDAPLAVAGERVLVASARLDLERTGDRALFALKAQDGAVAWKLPLTHNPWGGPTTAGDLVLVGGSNIRLETKDIPNAKGEVVAADLASGAVKWRRDIPGGVVASVAVKDKLAVFTATDGKVRAVDVASGSDRWSYDAQAPLFAAPAIAGAIVYAADLQGRIHAINLADGKPVWKLEISSDPAIRAPGQIYGAPVVAAGRLFVATCNLEASAERRPTVVVCVGEK